MNCPECGTRNRADAPFCIECGEPLALNNAPEGGRPRLEPVAVGAAGGQATTAGPFGGNPDRNLPDDLPFPASMIARLPRPFNPLFWGLEVRITVVVLVVAIVADLLIQGGARSDAQNYDLGVKAEQEHRWHDAATLLAPLASKGYQDASAHYKNVEAKVTAFDEYYNWAQGAKVAGSPIRVALYYKSANEIEPGYEGVDRALSDAVKNGGQLLYQTDSGLFLANVIGNATSALPGSDARSEVLAVSADGTLVCYTGFDITQPQTQTLQVRRAAPFFGRFGTGQVFGRGRSFINPGYVDPNNGFYPLGTDIIGTNGTNWQAATRKVYIRNLRSGTMESFDDVPGSGYVMSVYRTAYFINNDKDLVFAVYNNDVSANGTQLQLSYFDITANSGLRPIGDGYTFAMPDETDTHLYYTPVSSDTETLGNSIVSYDLNSNRSLVIARSNGNIGHLTLGGNASSEPSSRVLFYAAAEDASLRIYSKMPPDTSRATMLVDVSDGQAGTSAYQVNIAPQHNGATAIAAERGAVQQGWLLQPAQGKATSLSNLGWDVVIDKVEYMQYSPDDSKVLIYGQAGQQSKSWVAVVDNSMDLTLHPIMLGDNADASAAWLGDSKHYYVYSNAGFAVMDATTGERLVYVARSNNTSDYHSVLSLQPDNQTLLYIANEGAYISNVDGHQPAEFIAGATAVWPLGVK